MEKKINLWLTDDFNIKVNVWNVFFFFLTLHHSVSLLFLLQVQESFVPLGGVSGELGLAIGGGADYGEFPFVTAAHGGGATVGDIILEIGGTPVLGMTLGDVRGVLNSCPHPIRIKTVSPGIFTQKHLRVWMLWPCHEWKWRFSNTTTKQWGK